MCQQHLASGHVFFDQPTHWILNGNIAFYSSDQKNSSVYKKLSHEYLVPGSCAVICLYSSVHNINSSYTVAMGNSCKHSTLVQL